MYTVFNFIALKLLTKLHCLSVWIISPNHLRNQIGTYPMNPEFKKFSLIVNNCDYFYLMHWKFNIRVYVCFACVCVVFWLSRNFQMFASPQSLWTFCLSIGTQLVQVQQHTRCRPKTKESPRAELNYRPRHY